MKENEVEEKVTKEKEGGEDEGEENAPPLKRPRGTGETYDGENKEEAGGQDSADGKSGNKDEPTKPSKKSKPFDFYEYSSVEQL